MIQAKLNNIPSASGIDYHDADELCGYQLLLCKIFEREGGLNYPPASNRLTAAIKREGMVWLREVRKSFAELFASPIPAAKDSGLSLEDMPRILGAYDFFYRICNGTACHDFIRESVLKCVNRYVKGDKSISQAQVVLMLQKEIERDTRTMEQRYLTFSGKVMESWVDDLERTGRIRQVSPSDSYNILKYLLIRDLFAFGVKRDSKLKWIKSYALSDEVLDSLDTKTLWHYIGFNHAAEYLTGMSLEEQDIHYARLFSRLATRDDIHPYFKEGLAIALSKHKTA